MFANSNQALEALQVRREENAKQEKVNIADSWAGNPKYFCCHGCNEITCQVSAIKFFFCDDCQDLIDSGTMTADELQAGNN